MIKAIIIDDEPKCITALRNDIKMFCRDVMIIDACSSAKEGILSIKRNQPDLIFLDVEMPWMNGFEMLEILDKDINFHIIFTTAHDQFAAKAFRVSALDYLLKPIDHTHLISAVSKLTNSLHEKESFNKISNLLHNSKVPAEQSKIAIPNRDGYNFIPVNQILYCKAEGSYTNIILRDNKKLLLSKSLGETEQMLPLELFERIHHSLIVNIQHVNQFRKSSGLYIVMDNGEELSVSKSKKDQLLLRLGIR